MEIQIIIQIWQLLFLSFFQSILAIQDDRNTIIGAKKLDQTIKDIILPFNNSNHYNIIKRVIANSGTFFGSWFQYKLQWTRTGKNIPVYVQEQPLGRVLKALERVTMLDYSMGDYRPISVISFANTRENNQYGIETDQDKTIVVGLKCNINENFDQVIIQQGLENASKFIKEIIGNVNNPSSLYQINVYYREWLQFFHPYQYLLEIKFRIVEVRQTRIENGQTLHLEDFETESESESDSDWELNSNGDRESDRDGESDRDFDVHSDSDVDSDLGWASDTDLDVDLD